MGEPHALDARGLRCPWPALRLAKTMRECTEIIISVDDPAAPGELRSLAESRGWTIERIDKDPDRFRVSRR